MCRPIKFIILWGKNLTNKFADILTQDQDNHFAMSLERTIQALIYNTTLRSKVVECMARQKNLGDEIIECTVLVNSLSGARADNARKAHAAKAAEAAAEAAKKAALARPQGQPDDEDGLDLHMERLSKEPGAPVDVRTTQEREAASKADIHCEAIYFTNNVPQMIVELEKRSKNQHWLILVDASNFRRQVQADYMGIFKDLASKGVTGRVMSFVGPNLHDAAACMDQMRTVFSAASVVDTKVVYGTNPSTNAGIRGGICGTSAPEYIISAQLPNTKGIKQFPHVLNVSQFRGVASDVMCLRCDGSCGFAKSKKDKEDKEGKQGDASSSEDIQPQECGNANFEDLFAMDTAETGAKPSDKRMWTFARSVEAYSTVLIQLGEITAAGTVVLVTGTASPNAMFAAHAAFNDLHVASERRLFVLHDRVGEHSWYHGKAQLKAALRVSCMVLANLVLATPQGKCLLNDLQFIAVSQEPTLADLADVPTNESPLAGLDVTVDVRTPLVFLVFVFCFSLRAARARLRCRRVGVRGRCVGDGGWEGLGGERGRREGSSQQTHAGLFLVRGSISCSCATRRRAITPCTRRTRASTRTSTPPFRSRRGSWWATRRRCFSPARHSSIIS